MSLKTIQKEKNKKQLTNNKTGRGIKFRVHLEREHGKNKSKAPDKTLNLTLALDVPSTILVQGVEIFSSVFFFSSPF